MSRGPGGFRSHIYCTRLKAFKTTATYSNWSTLPHHQICTTHNCRHVICTTVICTSKSRRWWIVPTLLHGGENKLTCTHMHTEIQGFFRSQLLCQDTCLHGQWQRMHEVVSLALYTTLYTGGELPGLSLPNARESTIWRLWRHKPVTWKADYKFQLKHTPLFCTSNTSL